MKKNNISSNDLVLPIVAAPMFLISNPRMVIECCKNGIIGTLPSLNQLNTEGFEKWLIEITESLDLLKKQTKKKIPPFGINLIVHHSNKRLRADLALCIKYQVPIIITSLGAVPAIIKQVHQYGGLVFHDIISKRHAEKAMEAGVDGLILVSAGAGGHSGTINPMALINEIKTFFKKTILLSGCISNGKDIATAMQMGADFAYIGTRFINTLESRSSDAYRQMIIESSTSDIIYTAAVSGVHGNFLRKSLENAGILKEMWNTKKKINFEKELNVAQKEVKAWKSIWSAGQGVASINDVISIEELVRRMRKEFLEALKSQYKFLKMYTHNKSI